MTNENLIHPIKELEEKLHDLKGKKDIESNILRSRYFRDIKTLEDKYILRFEKRIEKW